MQPGMANNNIGMIGGMMPQQQQQGMTNSNMGMANPSMQQQNMEGGLMMSNSSQMMNGGQMMSPQMMVNGNVQQQQQMMMMMMMQQQQMQKANTNMNQMNMNNGFPQPGNQNMMGGMMNSFGSTANNNVVNAMGQSMQQMSLGGAQTQNNADDGGFGAPMGGNAPQKDDPFSSLGGMNAFR